MLSRYRLLIAMGSAAGLLALTAPAFAAPHVRAFGPGPSLTIDQASFTTTGAGTVDSWTVVVSGAGPADAFTFSVTNNSGTAANLTVNGTVAETAVAGHPGEDTLTFSANNPFVPPAILESLTVNDTTDNTSATTTLNVSETGGQVPEAPYAVALPLLAIGAGVWAWRRRQTARGFVPNV